MPSAFIERPTLLAKIDEQKAEIAKLEAKVAELRKGNDYLKAEIAKQKEK
jgi:cell division protein FtsB